MDIEIKSSKWKKSSFGDPRDYLRNLTKESATKLSKKIIAEGSLK